MSPSSDIETLFGHFGGNPAGYQEIGRESEASTARTRWPLLVTLNLKQPSIPAIAQQHEPLPKQGNESGPAQAPHGDAPAPGSPAEARGTAGTPVRRSQAPLFDRPHRRSVPPVANAVNTDAPRNFAPASAPVHVSEPPAAPAFAFASATGFSASAAAPARPEAALATKPTSALSEAPSATTQPPSILRKLFLSAAPGASASAQSAADDSRSASLRSIFDRLRGAAGTPAEPAPNSWLTNGPRRS